MTFRNAQNLNTAIQTLVMETPEPGKYGEKVLTLLSYPNRVVSQKCHGNTFFTFMCVSGRDVWRHMTSSFGVIKWKLQPFVTVNNIQMQIYCKNVLHLHPPQSGFKGIWPEMCPYGWDVRRITAYAPPAVRSKRLQITVGLSQNFRNYAFNFREPQWKRNWLQLVILAQSEEPDAN